jgi:hypothetical protein
VIETNTKGNKMKFAITKAGMIEIFGPKLD